MTLGKLFEVCLGSKTYVPYFISEGMKVKASAEYSRSDKCVYVEINYSTRVSSTFREDMRELFLANGFKSELSDEIFEDFSKDDFYISFLIIDGEVIVNMTLPLGSILD